MSSAHEAFARAERELSHPAPEPTLDEVRSDLARAIGDFANQNFADQYGPLVGSVVENTAEQILRDLEINGLKARTELTFVAQELANRILRGLNG